MSFGPTLRILGLLLMLFSLTMLPPMGISLIFGDGQIPLFGAAALLIFGAGLLSWLPARRQKKRFENPRWLCHHRLVLVSAR